MSIKWALAKWYLKREFQYAIKENNMVKDIWKFFDGKKRNIGLLLIGLGFVVDAITPFIQAHVPFPIPAIAEWLKLTGGGFAAVGGVAAIRKGN